MADVSVRRAGEGDVAAVADLQIRTWRTAYSGMLPAPVLAALSVVEAEERWRRAVTEPPTSRHHLLVALEAGRVVGMAAAGPSEDEDRDPARDAEIYALLVEPDLNRRGHGSRLLAAGVEHLRQDGFGTAATWLFDADAGCQAFYESAGWALDGTGRQLDMDEPVHQVRLHTDIAAG